MPSAASTLLAGVALLASPAAADYLFTASYSDVSCATQVGASVSFLASCVAMGQNSFGQLSCANSNVVMYSGSTTCTTGSGVTTSTMALSALAGGALGSCAAPQQSGGTYSKYTCKSDSPSVAALPAGVVQAQYADASCTTLVSASSSSFCSGSGQSSIALNCSATQVTTKSFTSSATCSGAPASTTTTNLQACTSPASGINIKQLCNVDSGSGGGGGGGGGGGAAKSGAAAAAVAAAAAAVAATAAVILA